MEDSRTVYSCRGIIRRTFIAVTFVMSPTRILRALTTKTKLLEQYSSIGPSKCRIFDNLRLPLSGGSLSRTACKLYLGISH